MQAASEAGTSSGDKVYALHLWPSAPILAQYIWSHRTQFRHKTVLELGAGGSALPSITAHKAGATRVIISDRADHDKGLELCRENCVRNGLPSPEVVALHWGVFTGDTIGVLPETIDWILASDCYYDPVVFNDLTATTAYLLHRSPDAKCLIAYQIRSSDWSIGALLAEWDLQCQLIPDCSFHKGCIRIPEFEAEMKRHTVQLAVITVAGER